MPVTAQNFLLLYFLFKTPIAGLNIINTTFLILAQDFYFVGIWNQVVLHIILLTLLFFCFVLFFTFSISSLAHPFIGVGLRALVACLMCFWWQRLEGREEKKEARRTLIQTGP